MASKPASPAHPSLPRPVFIQRPDIFTSPTPPLAAAADIRKVESFPRGIARNACDVGAFDHNRQVYGMDRQTLFQPPRDDYITMRRHAQRIHDAFADKGGNHHQRPACGALRC
ncbi:hypothetical protein GCM10027040_32750 [Halomonas shantousis]